MPKPLIGLVISAVFLGPASLAAAPPPDLPAAERQLLEDTNAFRREHSLPPLRIDPRLDRAAGQFARFMAGRDELGHHADGRTPVERARAAGYEDCMVAENIAEQFRSGTFETRELAERFMAGWVASPGHRRNLLDADAVEVGVGVARSERSTRYYAVQLFGRPRSLRVTFEVRNESSAPVRYRVGDKAFTLAGRTEQRHEACGDVGVTFERRDGDRPHKPATGDRYTITPQGVLLLPPRREGG